MRSTHSAAACRVSRHSAARLRKPCGRSSTTRSVTGWPRPRSRRANMTESSSMGSSAQACGGGAGKCADGGVDRGRRHEDGGGENRRMSLTGFCLASPSPERPTLSLPLPRLSKPSACPAISTGLQKQTGNFDPLSPPVARPSLLLAPLSLRPSFLPFPPLGSPGAPFSRSSRPLPAPLLACSTFLAWRSPRCAQVAESAACCRVPAAVT